MAFHSCCTRSCHDAKTSRSFAFFSACPDNLTCYLRTHVEHMATQPDDRARCHEHRSKNTLRRTSMVLIPSCPLQPQFSVRILLGTLHISSSWGRGWCLFSYYQFLLCRCSISMLSPTSDMCSQMSVVSLLKCRLARPKIHRPTAAMLNPNTATYMARHNMAMHHETDGVTFHVRL